jgi:hypothetical protein
VSTVAVLGSLQISPLLGKQNSPGGLGRCYTYSIVIDDEARGKNIRHLLVNKHETPLDAPKGGSKDC